MKSTRNLALASILFALTFTVAPHTAAAMGISTEMRVASPAQRVQLLDRFSPETLRMILTTIQRLVVTPF
jgi:Na+-transporting NADH:ubiquinone oxidoreductase subunit NqrD